ncbi:hypothetical protein [uncultured Vibrio sp.]|nr:hypothetical protein [uncultured Vibrio sp.]
MNYELGHAYIGHLAAKKMMHEAMYGKPKKPSFFKRMIKKMAK